MKIAIIGTGYVGLVTGTCFAEMGNIVTCIDNDKNKIDNLNKGIVPIYEPGLDELIRRNADSGRLLFSTNLLSAMNDSNILIIAVGTPESATGEANMDFVFNVAREIGTNLCQESIVVDKSTVPVGTAEKIKTIILEELDKRKVHCKFHIVSNPEFLKEGDAIQDFMRPDRIVIGSSSKYAIDIMKQLYAPFTMKHNRLLIMGLKEAEMTKYAANAMLATKISFINEIAHICDNLDIDVEDVRIGIGSDSRIGYSFIYPGSGYGGSCFPKDVKSIMHIAKNAGVDPIVLNAVEKRNQIQKNRVFDFVVKKYGKNILDEVFSIWGLSFKPGTDDMREAPSINIISSIIKSGGIVKAFDPVANEESRKYFPKKWFDEGRLKLYVDHYDTLDDSIALIIMTEWKMFLNPDFKKIKKRMKKLCILDGRNQYDPAKMKKNGFYYKGIGR